MDALAEIYERLGEEGLKKARYQERLRVYSYLLGVLAVALYTALWYLTGADGRIQNPFLAAYAYALGLGLFTFPLAYYFGRYKEIVLGTNRQSLASWLVDWAKSLVVNTLFLGTLIGAVFYAAMRLGTLWPFAAFLIVFGLVLILYLAQPYLVRLIYRAEPLEDPELNARFKRLFEAAGLSYRGVYLIKESEKSSRGNAAVIPSPKGGYEVHVYDTLLEELDHEALEAVVAHELGHIVHRDLLIGYVAYGLAIYVSVLAAYLAARALGPLETRSLYLFAGVLLISFQVLELPLNALWRFRERLADAYALRRAKPEALARALVVLSRQNLADPDPPPWVEALLHNHPSLKKRLEVLERAKGGEK